MYIIADQGCKWRQRKRKKNFVSLMSRFLVMAPLGVLATAGIAMAAPTGGVITGGSGSIAQVDTATNINQTTQRLDINWQTFSTQANESINFFQPNSQAIAINRVIGGVPSELRGALNANGGVFVLNNAGITFYGTSQVNVGALLATTAMDVTEDGSGFSFSGHDYGQVLNQGVINVSDGGFAVLAAPYVANTGVVQANLGTVQLASTNAFTMDFRGDGLIDFTVPKGVLDGVASAGGKLGVDNSGVIKAGSGTINITANLASDVIQSVVNLDGVVDASAFGPGSNGGAVLISSVGDTNVTGEVHADGGAGGNGGTVYTWADGTNNFGPGAVMTARGGETAGDGGTVEVSGNDVLVRGTADASAANGEAGTFIIDPYDLTIAEGAGSDSSATVYEQNVESASVGGTNVDLAANHSITMQDLTLNSGDGVLTGGDGNISMTVTDGGPISFENKSNTITTTTGKISMSAADGLEGDGSINVGNLVTTGYGGDISLTAGTGGITTGNLTTGGESLGINMPGVVSLTTNNGGNIKVGDVSIIAEGNPNAAASFTASASGSFEADSLLVKATALSYSSTANSDASADISAGGDLTVNGNVTVDADTTLIFDSAAANAGFDASAGGNINLLGGLDVNASASQPESYGYYGAYADAFADLRAGNDINITGNVNVTATAYNNVSSGSETSAYASLYADAGNDLTITGNTLVQADANMPQGSYDAFTSGSASADLYAGHNLTVNGDVSVIASAVNNAENGSSAEAYANLSMETGGEAGGDINITGNTLVQADATLGNGYYDAYGSAYAYIYADHDLNITGDISVLSSATNNNSGAYDGSASAYLYVGAANNLTLAGDTLVKAEAMNNGYEYAYANAYGDFYAGNNMNITGDVKVQSTSMGTGTEAYYSSAYSDLYMDTDEGDLNVTGDVLVTADAHFMGSGSATASAYADIEAGNDLNMMGDIAVKSNAENSDYGSETYSTAELYARAWRDLNVTGDILVQADATGGEYTSASASADIAAGRNVTLLTDPITVAANATGRGYYYGYSSAYANIDIAAGTSYYDGCSGDCQPIGDLYITGDISATATAGHTESTAEASLYSSEYASVSLSAPGSVTDLYGTAPPKAYAPDPTDPAHALAQSDEGGYFYDSFYGDGAEGYAELSIDGSSVTIEPKSTVSPPNVQQQVVSSLEAKDVTKIEPTGVGNEPLRIASNGEVLWATGVGVTSPAQALVVTPEAQDEIAKGADPTKVLPSPAAGGGIGLSSGLDAYSIGGPDYCDKVVSGYCLPESDGKKME